MPMRAEGRKERKGKLGSKQVFRAPSRARAVSHTSACWQGSWGRSPVTSSPTGEPSHQSRVRAGDGASAKALCLFHRQVERSKQRQTAEPCQGTLQPAKEQTHTAGAAYPVPQDSSRTVPSTPPAPAAPRAPAGGGAARMSPVHGGNMGTSSWEPAWGGRQNAQGEPHCL